MINQNIQTIRLIEVSKILKKQKQFETWVDMCIKLKYLNSSWNSILHSKRDINISLLVKFVKVFRINPEYIIKGIGDYFLNDHFIDDLIDDGTQNLINDGHHEQELPTVRMLYVFELLKKEQNLKTIDLCRDLDVLPQSWNMLQRGKGSALIWLISGFCERYNVSSTYILLGKHPIFVKKTAFSGDSTKRNDPKYMATNLATNVATNHENRGILANFSAEPQPEYSTKQNVPNLESNNTIKVVIHVNRAILEANKDIIIHITPEMLRDAEKTQQ